MAKDKFQTIRGTVTPADWDDDNHVISLMIISDDEEEFFVDPAGKGEQLLDWVDHYVEIKGIVHNDDGDYTITVHKFKPIDEYDEDEDDGEGEDEEDEEDEE
ncbi:MAG: hypothetical protein V1754_06285 [Pseudomonadota bacterium]